MISNQKGFTLIEVILDLAISGLMMGALIPCLFQINRSTGNITDNMTGMLQVQNAGNWINRDVKLAAAIDLVEGAPPVDSLAIEWTDIFNGSSQEHTVQYFIVDETLKRSYDGMVISVAQFITNLEFSLSGSVVTVDITCSPEDAVEQRERGIYNVVLRQ